MKFRCRHWRSARWNCASSSCLEARCQCKQAGCSVSISACRPDFLVASTTASCTCTRERSLPKCSFCDPIWSRSPGGGALPICTTTTDKAFFCAFGGRKTANGIHNTSSAAAISRGPANGFGTSKSGSSMAIGWLVVLTPSGSHAVGTPVSFACGLRYWERRSVKPRSPNCASGLASIL